MIHELSDICIGNLNETRAHPIGQALVTHLFIYFKEIVLLRKYRLNFSTKYRTFFSNITIYWGEVI